MTQCISIFSVARSYLKGKGQTKYLQQSHITAISKLTNMKKILIQHSVALISRESILLRFIESQMV